MKPKNKTRISVKEFVAQTQDTNQTQTADPNSTTGGVPLVWGGYDYPQCRCCPYCGRAPWQQWPCNPYPNPNWYVTSGTTDSGLAFSKHGSTVSIN